jgi:hypothetical protein
VCCLFSLNSEADLIVDLGSAADFTFLDISENPAMDAVLDSSVFTGKIGWSGGLGSQITLNKATVTGDIYLADGSTIKLSKKTTFGGVEHPSVDMSGFIADVNLAVAQFGTLTQDINLGSIDQQGGLTIDRTDAYTVVDMDTFKLSSGTLTLNGQENDIFYIRVSDAFQLNNVDVVVNGTDSSRVFFIYDGIGDLAFSGGDFLGNIIAPNASVVMTRIDSFSGTLISGDGFSVKGANKKTPFDYTAPIPEATALSLVTLFGCGAILTHRFFRFRRVNQSGQLS